MIDLKKHKLDETKKNPREHTWRALEEILAYDVLNDKTLVCSSDKNMYLRKIYNDAKLQAIRDSSLKMKLSNYNALSSGSSLDNCNAYTKDVFISSSDLNFQSLYNDIYINFWRKNTLKNINLNIFKNHDIKLLYSNGYSKSKYALTLSLTLGYFTKKIEEYEKAMLKYVTPQHYIEHVNAIGHLDKIIILSESEAKIIEGCLNQNIPGDICDFMGMFIPGLKEIAAKELSSLLNEKVNKKETAILLCPENMWQMMSSLKNNKPTLMEMVDKVFSHEIGHLAFYFYYSKLGYHEGWRTIAEKQANWISSIAHDGKIDELIDEICSLQPFPYHYPVLLKHKNDIHYNDLINDLYLR